MAVLALEGVTKRYGSVVALSDCSLSLETDGFHGLVGPNGSGKTTLLRLLLGLERPTGGTVTRRDVTLGSGFQRPSFYPGLTARENLDVFARLHGNAPADWRERLVADVGLDPVADRPAGALSGGFARRLDLALALLHRPDVVLLDEPLGALDEVSRVRLLEVLADYADAGHGVVVSTHRLGAVEPHLDRLTVLDGGTVVLDGPTASLPGEGSLEDRYLDLLLENA